MKAPLSQYPGMNPFVLDWMAGDERFLPRGSHVARSSQLAARSETLASALDASNRHWGIFAEDAIQSWARGETRTIIAGQQVGFAGGPLYTLAKIASIVKMKRELERQGTPATALFWLATEDHDFDEVATLNVPARLTKTPDSQVDLMCIRATRGVDSRAVVGSLPIPEPLIAQLLTLLDISRPAWLREGITFRDSFAELIASLFGNEVILVDALLPELRLAGAPLFDAIESRHEEIHQALAQRGRELSQAGYKEQVIPNERGEYTLLYELDEHGHRQTLNAHSQTLNAHSHTRTANRRPERTSTSALTRPLLQDFVLRPDVFIGGPAEVAYYAQIAPLHELLGITMPRVALRGHVLVAPKRVARAMERFGIEPAEVFAAADALIAEREPEGVARIREILDDGKRELMQRIAQVGELALPADHSLASSIQRSIGHLEFHFNKLGERAIKGLIRKDRERFAAIREIVATLYPDRHVQDRTVSWYAYWHAYGAGLTEQILAEVEPDSAFFKFAVL
ncbi:MAG: bacillithiol biosynthesis cysteine-adding enzyme BshC [Acidobacteriota bacterium]|nr:bacillithiol biosynthesis cysteine-adding enzyme BshC [Acidobacteriota bacterium]